MVEEIKAEQGRAIYKSGESKLPAIIDVSDIIEHYYFFYETIAKRNNKEFNIGVTTVIVISIGIGVLSQMVCEDGRPFKIYKSEMGGKTVTAMATQKYTDKQGRTCRKITIDQPQFGDTDARISTHSLMCKEEGTWKLIETIERNEY